MRNQASLPKEVRSPSRPLSGSKSGECEERPLSGGCTTGYVSLSLRLAIHETFVANQLSQSWLPSEAQRAFVMQPRVGTTLGHQRP